MFRYFSLSKKSSFIFIDTENPALPQVDAKRRRIPELPRGVGFHILSELANKYDGGGSAGVRDGMFCARLTLREMK